MREVCDTFPGRCVAFVGDGNNVARSLAVGCGKLGIRFVLAAPKGYEFDEAFLKRYRQEVPEGDLHQTTDPRQAVRGADFVYTDVWASMGQEDERSERSKKFASFQVNAALLKLAPGHARVMHCLPAHRGEEVTSDVLDGDRSIVFEQAANRMHAQKALLVWLLR
jgi:ornithine carbamoyltransferase